MGRTLNWGARRVATAVRSFEDVRRTLDDLQSALLEAFQNAQADSQSRGSHQRLLAGVYTGHPDDTYLLLGDVTFRLPKPFDGQRIQFLNPAGKTLVLLPGTFLLENASASVTYSTAAPYELLASCNSWWSV